MGKKTRGLRTELAKTNSVVEEVKLPPADRQSLMKYARSTDLGVLVVKIRDQLVEEAMLHKNPKMWLQNQAYAVQQSIDSGKGIPSLPDESASGIPRDPPTCVTKRHEVVCWSLRGRHRQYICQTCGNEVFDGNHQK